MDSIVPITTALADFAWPLIVGILLIYLAPVLKRFLRRSSEVTVEVGGTKISMVTDTNDAETLANKLHRMVVAGDVTQELIRGYKEYLDSISDDSERLTLQRGLTYAWMSKWPELNKDVRLLKLMLQRLNCYEGQINDDFDMALVSAISSFQKKHGLVDDGVFGIESYSKARELILKDWLKQ